MTATLTKPKRKRPERPCKPPELDIDLCPVCMDRSGYATPLAVPDAYRVWQCPGCRARFKGWIEN
jgi:hypothetical protein